MRASQPAEDKAPSRSEDAESLACGRVLAETRPPVQPSRVRPHASDPEVCFLRHSGSICGLPSMPYRYAGARSELTGLVLPHPNMDHDTYTRTKDDRIAVS